MADSSQDYNCLALDEFCKRIENTPGFIDNALTKYATSIENSTATISDSMEKLAGRINDSSDSIIEKNISLRTTTNSDGSLNINGQTKDKIYHKDTLDIFEKINLNAKDLNETTDKMGKSFGSAFENAIFKGKDFSDVLRVMEKELQSIMLNSFVKRPLEKYVQGFFAGVVDNIFSGGKIGETGGGSSGIFKKLMNYFSPISNSSTDDVLDLEFQFGDALPKRNTGGSTSADKARSVGKNNPDNFSPGFSGDGNPNMQTYAESGNIYNTFHMTINTPDAQSFRANQGEILAAMNRAMLRGQRNM